MRQSGLAAAGLTRSPLQSDTLFFKPPSCESGVQPILGPLTRPGNIAETFPHWLVGFLINCGVFIFLAAVYLEYL